MSVKPKSTNPLVEKYIKNKRGRRKLAAATSVLALFTVLITVGALTFPAISISGNEEALQSQGIDLAENENTVAMFGQDATEAPSSIVDAVADRGSAVSPADQYADAPAAEADENTADPIQEDTYVEGEASEEPSSAKDADPAKDAAAAEDAEELANQAAEEEGIEASQAAKDALAAADLSSQRLIVGSEDATTLAEDANLVASFDNVYLLQYASAEEAAKGFLKYFDAASYVTPDVAVEIAEGENNADPEEDIITTDAVYTEEENPFVELEAAIEENEAEIAAEAKKQDALVALIDTGAKVEGNVVEAVSMLGENAEDENGHGVRMVRYIAEENENARILSIKALGKDGKGDVSALIAAINYATERGANIINLSASAYASEENAALAEAVKAAEEAGIVVIGAAGNNGFNAKYYIPGNIEEATIVGACDEQGLRIKQSNFGETVDYNVAAGSTSEAAARLSGFVSANGEEAIADALNQGLIFSTDYVAPEAEEEAVEEGEGDKETPESTGAQLEVADISFQDGSNVGFLTNSDSWAELNSTTAVARTWDALKMLVEDKEYSKYTTIQLGDHYGGIAAYCTIEVAREVTITKCSDGQGYNTIYRDAGASDDLGPYFKVTGEGKLILDGVVLTGQEAATVKDLAAPAVVSKVEFDKNNQKLINFINAEGDVRHPGHTKIFEAASAVEPGEPMGNPQSKTRFAIRKDGSSNYDSATGTYLGVSNGNLVWSGRISHSSVVGHAGYTWEIRELDGNTFLWNEPGKVAVTYDGKMYWPNGIPARYPDGANVSADSSDINAKFCVTPRSSIGLSTVNDKAYFVQLEGPNAALDVKNGSILEKARGGNAPIYAIGGTVNILGASKIQNNVIPLPDAFEASSYASKTAEEWIDFAEDHHLNTGGTSGLRGDLEGYIKKENADSAGAILLNSGAKLTIGSASETNNTPTIAGNKGRTGAIRVLGGSTVDQYASTIGSASSASEGNLGGEGGAVYISGEGSTYHMHSGTISYNTAITNGGGVDVVNKGTFHFGEGNYETKEAGNSLTAPVINNNTAVARTGGGIDVDSDNVHLYNGEIANNRSFQMGGGVYVHGDENRERTRILKFPMYNGVTNAYVYDNYAFVGGYWDGGGHLNGDGGGIWFCNWGSYLFDENYLEVFRNKAGVSIDDPNAYTKEDSNNPEEKKYDKVYKGNGDDFSKQGARDSGQGLGAGFVIKEGSTWKFDRPDKTHGINKDGSDWSTSPYSNGATLVPQTVFPTERNMNLKNYRSSDTVAEEINNLNSKNKLIIHGNSAPNGGGIGCNGVITGEKESETYKKIEADLILDKKWTDNGQEFVPTDKKLKLSVDLIDANGKVVEYCSQIINGNEVGSRLISESSPDAIKWDKWNLQIDLPTFIYTENEAETPVYDYTKLDTGEIVVDGNLATIDFNSWKIRVTEQLVDASGKPTTEMSQYTLNMDKLYEESTSTYTDTGQYFTVNTTTYTLSSTLTNTKKIGWAEFNKVNELGQPVSGARLQILDADGNVVKVPAGENGALVDEWTTTSENLKVKLPAGLYTLKELEAPNGYIKSASVGFEITLENTQQNPVVVTMVDITEGPGKVVVSKIEKDEKGNSIAVPGATLQIFKADGVTPVTDPWITDGSPKTFVLNPGTYVLKEIMNPLGYASYENVPSKTFTVKASTSGKPLPVYSGTNYVTPSGFHDMMTISSNNVTNTAYCVDMYNHAYAYSRQVRNSVELDKVNSGSLGGNLTSGTVTNKSKIKDALWIGYPNDAAGIMSQLSGTEQQKKELFYQITQAVIWHYTNNLTSADTNYDTHNGEAWSAWYKDIFAAMENPWYSRIVNYIDGTSNQLIEGDSTSYKAPESFNVSIFGLSQGTTSWCQPFIETYSGEQPMVTIELENERETGEVSVEKKWEGSGDPGEAINPPEGAEVKIALYRQEDGKDDKTPIHTFTLNAENNWKDSIDGLELINYATGKPYTYSVEELTNLAGFEVSYEIKTNATISGNLRSAQGQDASSAPTSSESTWAVVEALEDGKTFILATGSNKNALGVSGTNASWINFTTANSAGDNVKWIAEDAGNGAFYLKNVQTGKYITLTSNTYTSSNGTFYYKYNVSAANTSQAAKFKLVNNSSGDTYLRCTSAGESGWNISGYIGYVYYGYYLAFNVYKEAQVFGGSSEGSVVDIGSDISFTVTNKATTHDFELYKVDSKDVANASADNVAKLGLAGAVFTLQSDNEGTKDLFWQTNGGWMQTDANDKAVRWETDSEGKLSFTGLPAGNYILQEVKAPDAYVASDKLIWNITVEQDGSISAIQRGGSTVPYKVIDNSVVLVIGNELQTYTLPSTGGMGTQAFAIVGALLMLVAGALYVRRTGRQGA